MAVVYYNQNALDKKNFLLNCDMKLLYVCCADAEKETALVPTGFHAHEENLELQYIFGGQASIRIGSRLYKVGKGDLIVYNAGVFHDEYPEHDVSFYNCGVKNFKLDNLPENHLLPENVLPVLHCGQMAECIQMLFRELVEQISCKKKSAQNVCYHLLNALLTIVAEQIPHEKFSQRESDIYFLQCKKYLDENFTQNISIEDMSKIANMSVSGFSHRFKKIFGLSPGQYLIRLKVGLGQKLLIMSDKSITEISLELGYDNVSYFNNQFKKFVGTSPRNYRKLWLGNEQFKNLNHIYNELMKR